MRRASLNIGSDVTRRGLLLGATGAGVSAIFGDAAKAGGHADIHLYAARQAQEINRASDGPLRVLIPNGSNANLAPIIAAFQDATGIEVVLEDVAVDDINAHIALDWMLGEDAHDVVLPATFGLPNLAEAGALRPIDDFAARHEPEGFRDNILYREGDAFDGALYGFQADGDAYVMFYNDLFMSRPAEIAAYQEQFGKPLSVPETWEELDRQIEWFHRPGDNMCGGALFRTPGYVGWEWWIRFHAKGQWPLNEDLAPLVSSDAGVTALEEMIRVTDFLCDGVAHFGLFDNWKRFAKGDVYANIGWGGSQKYFHRQQSPVRNKLRFGQTPGGMIDGQLMQTPYFNWGWTYAVTATARQPEVAYLFTLFASSPAMSREAIRQQDGFFDPFRSDHYEDAGIQEIYSPEFLEVQRQSLENAIPDFYLRNQSQYLSTLNEWIGHALNQRIGPQQAMERIAERWQDISNQADHSQQRARWQRLRQKYPSHVRSRLRFDI